MSAIRAVLCDDEPEWLEQGRRALDAYAQSNKTTFEIRSFTDGAAMFASCDRAPDVLFCDVELNCGKSGIDLVREVGRVWPSCQVVYVSNHLRYAPEVYVTEHMWFVLKDRFEEHLPNVIQKLRQQMEDGSCALSVRTVGRQLLSVPCAQIVSLGRKGRVTTMALADGSSFQIHDRLTDLLELLPERLFIRTHGSYVVGFAHIRLAQHGSVVMQNGTEIPISRRYYRNFCNRYLEWVEGHAP